MMLPKLATLLVTIFAACAFAAPAQPNSDHITTSELRGDYFNGTTPTANPVLATGLVVASDGEVDDATNPALAGTAGEPQQELRITMGTHLQHVGYTISHHLSDNLRTVLDTVCYGPSLHLPNPRSCRKDVYWITDIAWTGHNDGVVKVQVESSDYSTHNGGRDIDLLAMFINQIVNTFEAAISCDKNRYQLNYFGCHEWANSADWYQVGIHGLGDGIFPHMRVKITFREGLEEGQFDCKGTQTSVWNTLPNYVIEEFATIMGYPLRAAVMCADKSGIVDGWPTGICNYDDHAMIGCKLHPDCNR